MDDVIEEMKRIVTDEGRIDIMEFNPIEMDWGPPVDIRLSPKFLEELFLKHDIKMIF